MGCSISKLDDEEAVQLCKDRKNFIKQALEQRMKFASWHAAYIESMRRVSAALRDYIEVDEPREFLLSSFMPPPPPPAVKRNPTGAGGGSFISISPKSFSLPQPQPAERRSKKSTVRVNYLRAGGTPAAVSIEERPPQSPETVRVVHQEVYSTPPPPVYYHHQYGNGGGGGGAMDGFLSVQSSSSFFHYSPDNRPNYPPPSPQQSSQWDFFWNPFSSLDYYGGGSSSSGGGGPGGGYGYQRRSDLDHMMINEDDVVGLRQVREEEGIPDLEEETEQEEISNKWRRASNGQQNGKVETNRNSKNHKEEVIVEDDDDDDDDDDDETLCETETETELDDVHELHRHGNQVEASTSRNVGSGQVGSSSSNGGGKELPRHGNQIQVSKSQNVGQVSGNETAAVADSAPKDEKQQGYTVYVNKRPTSMDEVIKELEAQFTIACDSAIEVSSILETKRAQYTSSSNDLAALKMLNPVGLIRSASSRSSSSRFSLKPSTSKDPSCDSSSENSEESSLPIHSHQSTLDRLYAWEKKLYREIREGERVRIAYEKKYSQLRSQDVRGVDPSTLDKTRAAIRDLHTQIKVSLHSAEAISKRIGTLRDEELQPQLLELVQGLARMWKVMAECHQMQKHMLDEAKILLAGIPKVPGSRKYTIMSASEPHQLARSAANLEAELRNWKTCFESWIVAQRSYIHALTGWLLRCVRAEPDLSKLPFSPRRSAGVPPIFGICIEWSRFIDAVREFPVLDGLDFFSAGVGSLYAQQLREDSHRTQGGGSKRFGGGGEHVNSMELVEAGGGQADEEIMSAEKLAEVAIRVLCAGMSVAVSSLAEFAFGSAKGYVDLANQWQDHPDLSRTPCNRES